MKLAKSRVFRVGRPARQLESPWELGTIDHPVISSHLTPWTNRRSSVLPKCFLRTHTHTEHTNTRNNLSYLSADDPSHTNKTEEKEQLKGGRHSRAVSRHSLSSHGGVTITRSYSFTGFAAAHRRASVVARHFQNFLVLPLGLLGHHLLHAERGQTDAEGGQQCGRSDRVLAGGLATGGGGRGVGELIHLRKQREKRNKFI